MSIVVTVLKVLPFLLALVTLAAVPLTVITGVRIVQHRIDKTTVFLGIVGLACLVIAVVSWKALFNYWNSGTG